MLVEGVYKTAKAMVHLSRLTVKLYTSNHASAVTCNTSTARLHYGFKRVSATNFTIFFGKVAFIIRVDYIMYIPSWTNVIATPRHSHYASSQLSLRNSGPASWSSFTSKATLNCHPSETTPPTPSNIQIRWGRNTCI